jgi:predicted acyltransferase
MADEKSYPGGSAPSPGHSQRLISLDALRGFDMFWIIGAEDLFHGLQKFGNNKVAQVMADQLEHEDWEGFHFYDLIFPLFVFIVGVSLVFSLGRTLETAGRGAAVSRVIRRGIILFLIGIFYYGGFSHEWPNIRLMGVLNRIALCYLFAGLFFCFFRLKGLLAICAALLVGYWALLTFVPFPDVRPVPGGSETICKETGFTNVAQLNLTSTNRVSGVYLKGVNLAHYVDQKYLPGMKWDGTWDPEGILSTLPAIATCLLGVFAGLLLKNKSVEDRRKVHGLLLAGLASVLLGHLWGLQFPVIKKIWTSSYVLVAGGYSAMLLGLFYLIVDVWKYQKWCQPFVWIGMNSITVYLANNIINFDRLGLRLAGGDVKRWLDHAVAAGFGDLVVALAGLGLGIWLCHFLYRRKIFLRL